MQFGADANEPLRDQTVAQLVNAYFDRRQSGEALTPEQFLAEHPDLADALRPYLEGLALIDQARSAVGEAEGAAAAATDGTLPPIEGYEVEAEIGRGGMGVVYRAMQIATKRIVAVKVMLTGPFASPAARKRFRREVQLAARLDHPGVAHILESGTVSGQPYYAMDYVDGVPLDQHLQAAAPDTRTTLELFRTICTAVEGAHQHSVIHRDLKPANILVDREGQPHVLDFGLAKAVDEAEESDGSYRAISRPGQVMGTLAYLSPEQAAGRPWEIDPRTDVYALGVMLYEALTGQFPYDTHGRPSEVIRRIQEVPPTPATKVSSRVDGEIETILLKALAKDRVQRYASARELGEDLARYLSGEPIMARRPSSLYIVRKKLAKHRTRITLWATIALLALAVLVGSTWWNNRQQALRSARDLAAARITALGALRLLEYGDIVPGRSLAQEVRGRNPELPEATLVLAQAAYRGGSEEQAVNLLARAPMKGPHAWCNQALLSEIYRSLGQVAAADELAALVQEAMPDTAEAWYLRSLAALDLQRAVEYARTALARDAAFLPAWVRVAYLTIQLGRLDDALGAIDYLIELEPRQGQWHMLRGVTLLRDGKYERAVHVYTDIVRQGIVPVGAVCRYRAVAYRRLKLYDAALADYNTIMGWQDDRPGHIAIWHRYQRATVLWITGDLEAAAADYRHVRAALSDAHYSDVRLAFVLRDLGRPQEARDVLAGAMRETADPWLAAIIRCAIGETPRQALIAAANSPEQQCEAFYYAGEAALSAAEPAEARRWFQRCVDTGLEFDPDSFMLTPMNEFELAEWRLTELVPPPDTPAGE